MEFFFVSPVNFNSDEQNISGYYTLSGNSISNDLIPDSFIDPMDDEAERFYGKHGFIKLPDSGKMFLPMNTIKDLFE